MRHPQINVKEKYMRPWCGAKTHEQHRNESYWESFYYGGNDFRVIDWRYHTPKYSVRCEDGVTRLVTEFNMKG